MNTMPYRDLQDAPAVCTCDQCGGELYAGDIAYHFNGLDICRDCFCDTIAAWLRESPDQVADELRVDYERV